MRSDQQLVQELSHVTVRLEVKFDSGQRFGTGFLYNLDFGDTSPMLTIITNKHVIKNAKHIYIILTSGNGEGKAVLGRHIKQRLEIKPEFVINHPDPSVDLCALPVDRQFDTNTEDGIAPCGRYLSRQHIPDDDEYSNLLALDNIVMVGYPIGLVDTFNNMPIFRRGATATHPCLNFMGQQEFLVDIACFPGSSGSPVFQYYPGVSLDGGITGGEATLRLLGITYQSYGWTVNSGISAISGPNKVENAGVRLEANLACVIKSSRIIELGVVLAKLYHDCSNKTVV